MKNHSYTKKKKNEEDEEDEEEEEEEQEDGPILLPLALSWIFLILRSSIRVFSRGKKPAGSPYSPSPSPRPPFRR